LLFEGGLITLCTTETDSTNKNNNDQDKSSYKNSDELKTHRAICQTICFGANIMNNLIWIACKAPYACTFCVLIIRHEAAYTFLACCVVLCIRRLGKKSQHTAESNEYTNNE